MAVFKGYSTIGVNFKTKFALTDVDLVKRDLLNSFFILPGEDSLRPDYGCRIPLYLMEPYQAVKQKIIDEATRVVNLDKRTKYLGMTVEEYPNGITLLISIEFLGLDVIDTLFVDFTNRSNALYGFIATN